MGRNTNKFKTIIHDLRLIEDLRSMGRISDETVNYIILQMYASNYDCLVNCII